MGWLILRSLMRLLEMFEVFQRMMFRKAIVVDGVKWLIVQYAVGESDRGIFHLAVKEKSTIPADVVLIFEPKVKTNESTEKNP